MMSEERKLAFAAEIMTDFARLTGLSPAGDAPKRYLWTDAFAVCNFLELHRATGNEHYRKLALLLVDQVHRTLGRHRRDDRRAGWLSGLSEKEGELHPTVGGLRIGKGLNERGPDEAYNARLEWDRDGQYFHYLTKWMHALNRVSAATGEAVYHRWAVELAKAAWAGFTYFPYPDAPALMYWKMSIDLSRPLVMSMGHHDPLDGLITFHELLWGAKNFSESPDLAAEIAGLADICRGRDWATDDPLGLGGLLSDAFRVAQMIAGEAFPQRQLLEDLLEASLTGLDAYANSGELESPARYRLAFRELGLSIGLHGLERMQRLVESAPSILAGRKIPESLARYRLLAGIIEDFWLAPGNRDVSTFRENRDINTVMLATSLFPDAFLAI